MIVEAIVNLVTSIVKLILIPFNILPSTPQELVGVVDSIYDMIFSHLDFLNFFVNVHTLKTVAIIAIIVLTLDNTFSLIMWIVHKLPLSIN